MTTRRRKASDPTPDHRPPTTPFAPCPTCGVVVGVRSWHNTQGWTPLPVPVSAALGLEHSRSAGTCRPPQEEL